jgi:hypothetical protein
MVWLRKKTSHRRLLDLRTTKVLPSWETLSKTLSMALLTFESPWNPLVLATSLCSWVSA